MRNGFTLFETVVVLGILIIILLIGVPISFDAYRNYILTAETRTLVDVMRRAETLASSHAYQNHFGVFIEEEGIVLFQGESFALRNEDFDEVYDRSLSVSATGTLEFVFAPLSGFPNVTGTVILSNGLNSSTIAINAYGVLSW